MTGRAVECVLEGAVEVCPAEVVATVDGMSDGAELDDAGAWALELLVMSADDDVPGSINGIFVSILG